MAMAHFFAQVLHPTDVLVQELLRSLADFHEHNWEVTKSVGELPMRDI